MYNRRMEKVVRTFRNFEEAEEADYAFYSELTPEQRLEILGQLLSLIQEDHGAIQRSARVYPLAHGEEG